MFTEVYYVMDFFPKVKKYKTILDLAPVWV